MVNGTNFVIATENLTDAELDSLALDLMRREFRTDGLARFLRLHRSGPGDYTVDRARWQRGISVDRIAETIRERKKKG